MMMKILIDVMYLSHCDSIFRLSHGCLVNRNLREIKRFASPLRQLSPRMHTHSKLLNHFIKVKNSHHLEVNQQLCNSKRGEGSMILLCIVTFIGSPAYGRKGSSNITPKVSSQYLESFFSLDIKNLIVIFRKIKKKYRMRSLMFVKKK